MNAPTSHEQPARFGLIVFDMDDTLYPEIDYVRSGLAAVADHLASTGVGSAADLFERMWRIFGSGDRRRIFDVILEQLNLQGRFDVPALVEVYRSHAPAIHLRSEAVETLASLRRMGMPLAVVTDGPAAQQKRKADALGLARHVDAIVFTDCLPPGCAKPSPQAFRRLMEQFDVAGPRCMYVADNPRKDFVGPRQLGWFTLQFVDEGGIYCQEAAPPGGEPHECIRDLREVLRHALADL
jgi:putative hydrolase of the HAD superfamily